MPNAESRTPLALRRDGKGKIWSHVRHAWFVEFPEEVVRQQFVCRLVNDYGFSLEQMDEEIATQYGRGSVERAASARLRQTIATEVESLILGTKRGV